MRGFDIMGNWDGFEDSWVAPVYDFDSDPSAYNDNVFWTGNTVSSATDPVPQTSSYDSDDFIPRRPGLDDAAAYGGPMDTAEYVRQRLAAGGGITPQQAADAKAGGLNLDIASIAGAAGAIFKAVRQANGSYQPVAVNAQAQQQLAQAQAKTRSVAIVAGIALLAFVVLKH